MVDNPSLKGGLSKFDWHSTPFALRSRSNICVDNAAAEDPPQFLAGSQLGNTKSYLEMSKFMISFVLVQ